MGFGAQPLPSYDYSTFGDANVGGSDVLITLGPLWSCSSELNVLEFLGGPGQCFRKLAHRADAFVSWIAPGIFPARIDVPGEGEREFPHPINRLLGEREHDGIRQLWSRSLMHLLGHSLGVGEADVGNQPAPAGRVQSQPDQPLDPLMPDTFADWTVINYAPSGAAGTPVTEAAPNYDELAAADPDGDGVPERVDNCPAVFNPAQGNVDDEFFGDACDDDIDGDGVESGGGGFSISSTDPFPYDTDNDGVDNVDDADDDGDGVADATDNCTLLANSSQADLEGDDVGDICDTDADGDGLLDDVELALDSRPDLAASQPEFIDFGVSCADGADNDADGAADGSDAGCTDADGDTVPDYADNCPTISRLSQIDSDGDGLGNPCDLLTRIRSVDAPYVASGEGAEIGWSATMAGTFSVRVGGADCLSGLEVDAGAYDPGAYDPALGQEPAVAFTFIAASELVLGPNTVRVCAGGGGQSANATTEVTVFQVATDTTPPTSQAGPLEPVYTSASIQVPYTASDDQSGVASVELWVRYRPNSAQAWGSWMMASTATSSPITYAFGSGDGWYEFYTVAIDGAGNREAAPAAADVGTRRGVTTTRVSESSSHGQGNGSADDSYISADGRYVTFQADASNLVTGDTNGVTDVFVNDRVTGTTTRVSVSSSGAQANKRSIDPAISADGRYVVFASEATNLVSGDTNGKRDIFVVDRTTGAVQRVSLSSSGAQANKSSSDPVISADGRYVAWRTDASNLVSGDTNAIDDIFRRDRTTNTTIRVSVATAGTQATGVSDQPAISDDGRYVVFASDASNLVSGDTNAVRDIFLRDTVNSTTSRVSVAAGGAQANALSDDPAISGDGTVVAFESDATNLIAGDTNAKQDVFVVILASGLVERASVSSSGVAGNHTSREPALSRDGRYVAFDSVASNFVAGDTNGKLDIYVRDRVGGTTVLYSPAWGAAVPGNNQSLNPEVSADGQSVAFVSDATNLVASDTNAARDVFVRGPAP
jgi:Tol biopolymer transport system component